MRDYIGDVKVDRHGICGADLLADEGSTPCSPKRFLIISNSRFVSLRKRFSATMTRNP